jgi:hypothetical protein
MPASAITNMIASAIWIIASKWTPSLLMRLNARPPRCVLSFIAALPASPLMYYYTNQTTRSEYHRIKRDSLSNLIGSFHKNFP